MALAIEAVLLLLTLSGLAYMVIALLAARSFARSVRRANTTAPPFNPGVTLLKPLKGIDDRMYEALASHCRQQYPGPIELIFGVSFPDDPAVPLVERLRAEFPSTSIHLVISTERLGTSGKVSNLVQMLRHATHSFVVVNDADIAVGPLYLEHVMQPFADNSVGMVTAPYLGRATPGPSGRIGLWSRLEALGISTDFIPGVLTARMLEGGIRFGLGSTLAMRRSALDQAGGFESVLECLADDYELGARIAAAGFRVELTAEVVETSVPAYTFTGFRDHQLRWARSTRDSRRWGYLGLGVTFCLPWALLCAVGSGFALWSLALLSMVLLARVAVALAVGVGILGDRQVLRDLWLIPLRDLFGLAFWMASFAGDTVIWRGERFRLHAGRLTRLN